VPSLAKGLKQGPLQVHKTFLDALIGIGPAAKEALSAVLPLVQSESDYVRLRAVQAVLTMGEGGPAVVSALTAAAKDKDPLVRVWAAAALEGVQPGSGAGLGDVEHMLNDRDEKVRINAAQALGELGPRAKASIPALIAALNAFGRDGNACEIARALGKIGPEGIQALIEYLKNGSRSERHWAAFALGEIGPVAKASIPALTEAAKDPLLATIANDALQKIQARF
jgi:HEAT repeat protein